MNKRFSVKIFAGITCLLLAVGLLVFAILRVFMPKIYTDETTEEIAKNSETFAIELESAPMNEWANMLMTFCVINNTTAAILDEKGNEVAIFRYTVTDNVDFGRTDRDVTTYTFTVKTDTPKPYTMVFYFDNEPVEKVENSFETMFPILFIVILVISLFIAFFYTRFIVNIKNLQSALEEEKRRRNFFSAVSHELKTPVTILKGELDGMILNVGKFSDRDRFLQEAFETTEAIESLVKEIMTAAKLDTVEISPEEINLSETANECLLKLSELIKEKDIKIKQNFSGKPVIADKKLIAIVISNIIGNAVKHSPIGAEIELEFNEDNELSVCNHGVETADDSFDSGGMGLYIVKSSLDMHGLKYSIERSDDSVKFTVFFRT
ncbi:MAG: HAMP domain-containing histidine kinase [Ruminococcus sp.]|nr:HAMP domain-containing histidine kinase [Ruminococcus sp.]